MSRFDSTSVGEEYLMNRRIILLIVGLMVWGCQRVSAQSQSHPSDWRAFRGNYGSGVSEDSLKIQLSNIEENLIWSTRLPGSGTSTPVVLGSRLFITCYSGYDMFDPASSDIRELRRHLVCLDCDDGRLLWKVDLEPQLPEQKSIREGHGYASNSPVVDEQRVYAFFGRSGVYAFDHGGKQLWHADVGSGIHGWGSGASLLRFENLLIVNASVESESLVALDCATGKEVWRVKDIKESWNTPIIVQRGVEQELVIAVAQKLLGIAPSSGQVLWSCGTDIPWYMVPSLVSDGEVVYSIGGRSGGSLAVRWGGRGDVTQTHRLWTINKGSNVPSPIYHRGHLYWMHESLGIAYCVDATNGELAYETRLPRAGQVYASPILVDDKILYLTRNGTLFMVAAKPTFELLATLQLPEHGNYDASPVIANSRLFIRTPSSLICLRTK